MKKRITGCVMVVFLSLLASTILRAQGTITYLSSLSPTSTGSVLVGSNSWLAAGFGTGNNATGYALDSVQLGMADASGNPNGFAVMLYSAVFSTSVHPGTSLAVLNGSLNPATNGIFTYTPVSNLILSPNTVYFIVLTAGTAVTTGAYSWNESAYPPVSSGGWGVDNALFQSSNGLAGWSPTPYLGIAQFAITATPVPEPCVLSLLGMGSLAVLWRRWKAKAN